MIKSIDASENKVLKLKSSPVNKLDLLNKTSVQELPNEQLAKVDAQTLQGYYVSFGGLFKSREEKMFDDMQDTFTPHSKREWNTAVDVAKEFRHKEVTHQHLYAALLEDLDKYIEDLNSGEKKHDPTTGYLLSAPLENLVSADILKSEKTRNKITPIIKKELESVYEGLERSDIPRGMTKNPPPSKDLVADLNYIYSLLSQAQDSEVFTDNMLLMGILSSQNDSVFKMGNKFVTELQSATMVEKTPASEKVHLKFYDDRADNLWKNVDLGSDMFVIYDQDNADASKFLLSSFANLINKPGQEYKNLNAKNTDLIFMNKNISFDYLGKVVENARKNPDKTTVIVADFISLLSHSDMAESNGRMVPIITEDDMHLLENKPPMNKPNNVRLILTSNKDTYYANVSSPALKKSLEDYGLHSLPILNADDTKKILTESLEFVKKETKKLFKPNAISRSIEVSNMQDGTFPEKTIKLMKNIAAYYVDKEEISLADVNNYLKQTKGLLKTTDSNSSFKVVFDTGKKLKDIVGNDMTKSEAASIVRQIKDKSIGTKGFIIYSSHGSSGGGRKHTAEAIAGEANIPFISINARDFALKDIDALSQNADLSELKIKKLVNMAKTQAEANKNKSAMIFIENFDNFGANPLTGISSIYEQKAFSQLLTEMENVRRNENINLVIVGSANYPEYIDEAIQKPYKFLDQIVVYSPQDKKDRIDVLNYYIKKNGLKIAGDTPEEKSKVIQGIAETTAYFSVVNLMDLLDKARNVSKERGHKAIDKSDFTEAYLQATSGRPSSVKDSDHRKAIVTSHECGHALNLQIMYDIAKKQNIPWHIPNKVDFITLDPRGSYGGAMYPKASENEEFGFEQVFSELVCDFGGHSSEKRFYNIDGSWGITADMQMASDSAKMAVQYMGLGPNTGKRSIAETALGTIDVSPRLRNNIDKDIELFLKNANIVSDMIVDTYAGFIEEFTQRYKTKVGTGECIIPSEVFQKELAEWKAVQSPETLEKLTKMENDILDIIVKTKKGESVK